MHRAVDNHHHPENDAEYAGLQVNAGVEQPPVINPYFRPKQRQPRLDAQAYIDGILAGDITILSQAVTLVESNLPSDQVIAQKVIPSSERSKGSILGDKTRMMELSTQANAFIRPSPSAGSLGGVARKTRESIVLCEAAGFDTVLVETVGVGQSETAAHSMVDFFLLLQVTGTGDELQGIKRGIMEMADGIAINKCDGNNIDKARVARTQFKNALALFPPHESGWKPTAVTCSSVEGNGIDDVWKMIEDYMVFTKRNGYFRKKRTEQSKYWMYETINQNLLDSFYHDPRIEELLEATEEKVLANKLSSFIAAHDLLSTYYNK